MIYYHKLQVIVVCVQWMNVCVYVILTKYFSGSHWIFFLCLENCKFKSISVKVLIFVLPILKKQNVGQYSPIMPEGYNICR